MSSRGICTMRCSYSCWSSDFVTPYRNASCLSLYIHVYRFQNVTTPQSRTRQPRAGPIHPIVRDSISMNADSFLPPQRHPALNPPPEAQTLPHQQLKTPYSPQSHKHQRRPSPAGPSNDKHRATAAAAPAHPPRSGPTCPSEYP